MKTSPLSLSLLLLAAACAQASDNPLSRFEMTDNAAISGYNSEKLSGVTAAQCASACLEEGRSWCVSFDYHKQNQSCDLSDKRAADVGGLKTDYPGNPYAHYSLKPSSLEQFVHVEQAFLPGYNSEQLPGLSAEACADACVDDQRSYWCQSFNYHTQSGNCSLSSQRAADVGGLQLNKGQQPMDYYERFDSHGIKNPIPGNKHILVIGLDGLRGDAIQCEDCAETPALDSLIATGAFHNNLLAGGHQSTFSGPGWSSVFTGFWADKHGVHSNDSSLVLQKPHVFDLIKQAYPTATTALVADWFNLTHNLKPAKADLVVSNANKNSQQATDTVKQWLGWQNPPTAIFYYLHNTDIHTHAYAPLHPTYQQKIRDEDQQIAQVLQALTSRPNYQDEEWLILVTSDHGGLGTGHGGQSTGERNTFLILNNSLDNPGISPYCQGDLSQTAMTQVDGVTPHILDFLGLGNNTEGVIHPSCGKH
ncbi:MAG: hypothetical protein WStaPseu_11380 [Shewanella algae]